MNWKLVLCISAAVILLLTTTRLLANSSQLLPSPGTGEQTSANLSKQVPQVRAGEQITWWVMGAGGERGTSTNFILFGTAGQTAIGQGTSPNFQVVQGFWQNFPAACQCGDANGDRTIDISDAVYLISYIFTGGSAPGYCGKPSGMGDANGDGTVDISDAVYLISYIFTGGSAPHCP